jgi:hypothetical protein
VVSDFPSFPVPVTTPSAANVYGPYHLFVLRDSIILTLRVRQKSVAGHEYARPNIGASITRANSVNGALPTRELEQGENKGQQANRNSTLATRQKIKATGECTSRSTLHGKFIR